MPILPMSIPSQCPAQNLCWAAVTIGVCTSLDDPPMTLGEVAAKYQKGCNGDISSEACDKTFNIEVAIRGYGHTVDVVHQISLDVLQAQIELQRPIPVALRMGFVKHACVIKGYLLVAGVTQVVVQNPADADPTDLYCDWNTFCNGTFLGGRWVDSFLIS